MNRHGIYITEYGTYHWVNGEPHNLNGPAFECKNGNKFWYDNGVLYGEGNDIDKKYWFFLDMDEFISEKDFYNKIYLYQNGLLNYD